jgi:hypothetical protein
VVFVRKVPGRPGATKVQLAERRAGRDVVVEHVGTARTQAELAALTAEARRRLRPGQGTLDLGLGEGVDDVPVAGRPATIVDKRSAVLWRVLTSAYARLGFDALGDEAFAQLVLARIVEPTSMADCVRVLDEIGVAHASLRTMFRSAARAGERGYRDQIAAACFAHAARAGDVSLCLYDVTTLYFEAESEDDLRKVGYSKERRVDPQVVVGLLVDRHGFPLEIGCFEGNKAETLTIVPIVTAFAQRHGIEGMVVVADAGMLSATNLRDLDEAGLGFIVGSRQTTAPLDLVAHVRWHGDAFTDGQVIDTITPKHRRGAAVNDVNVRAEPVWTKATHPGSWRAIWAYSAKRFTRDNKTLNAQEARARAVVDGDKTARTPRFVKAVGANKQLDETALARARQVAGLKGYVTNIDASVMSPGEVIGAYHDLWHVEQSFRMSKTDLRARPMFHHTRDAIEAHLTVVFAALAIARYLQDATGQSIKKVVRTLRPLQQITVRIAGHDHLAEDPLPDAARSILTALDLPPQ